MFLHHKLNKSEFKLSKFEFPIESIGMQMQA